MGKKLNLSEQQLVTKRGFILLRSREHGVASLCADATQNGQRTFYGALCTKAFHCFLFKSNAEHHTGPHVFRLLSYSLM